MNTCTLLILKRKQKSFYFLLVSVIYYAHMLLEDMEQDFKKASQ